MVEYLVFFPAFIFSPTVWANVERWPSSLLAFPLIRFRLIILSHPFTQKSCVYIVVRFPEPHWQFTPVVFVRNLGVFVFLRVLTEMLAGQSDVLHELSQQCNDDAKCRDPEAEGCRCDAWIDERGIVVLGIHMDGDRFIDFHAADEIHAPGRRDVDESRVQSIASILDVINGVLIFNGGARVVCVVFFHRAECEDRCFDLQFKCVHAPCGNDAIADREGRGGRECEEKKQCSLVALVFEKGQYHEWVVVPSRRCWVG